MVSALALGGCGGDDDGGGSGGSGGSGTGGSGTGGSGTGGSGTGGSGTGGSGTGGTAGSGGLAGSAGAAGGGGVAGGTGGTGTGGTGTGGTGTGGTGTGGTGTGGTGTGGTGTGGTGTGGTGTGGSGTGGSGAFWPAAYNASCTPSKSSPGNHTGFAAMDCLTCHKQGGAASGKDWQFGGVVWTSAAATAGAPNVEVGVKDGTNFIYVCTDSKGFFFADTKNTTAPNWATAEIRIRSAAGEKTMQTKAVQAGTCNASACHSGSTKLVKP